MWKLKSHFCSDAFLTNVPCRKSTRLCTSTVLITYLQSITHDDRPFLWILELCLLPPVCSFDPETHYNIPEGKAPASTLCPCGPGRHSQWDLFCSSPGTSALGKTFPLTWTIMAENILYVGKRSTLKHECCQRRRSCFECSPPVALTWHELCL